MESRSVGFSLAGLAGVSALLAALSAGTRTQPTMVAPVTTAQPVERGEIVRLTMQARDSVRANYRQGTRLLQDYARREIGCLPSRSDTCATRGDSLRDSLQILIASIPDPYDSHLDWAYDAYLEAFRRAFASAGYVPDRYWLPAVSDSLHVVVGRDTQKLPLHDVFPGVLLFRNQNTRPHKLALLYLVNELPTSGLHKEAFLAAMRERRLLMHDNRSFAVSDAVRDTLLIAGPIFSGAAQSMRLALSDAVRFVDPSVRGVRIVTGSATSGQNKSTLDTPIGSTPVAFQATLNSDDAMRVVLDSTIRTLGLSNDQVAILSEASTQYGQQRLDSTAQYLTISFPLSIGSLRNEVDESSNPAATVNTIPGLSETARTKLVLRERSRTRETPTVVSELTVPTIELMLSEIVQILADRDIRAVVIQATDIRDQLMLAREIRRRNRNTQIITFQGHRLLLRPEFSAQLNGTLVLTSYPLFLSNQWWTRADTNAVVRELLSLSNDAAIGTFNAVLTLLDRRESRVEYESPNELTSSPRLPPIWLTAVANRTFVPISVTSTPAQFRSYFGNDSLFAHPARRSASVLVPKLALEALGLTAVAVALVIACVVVLVTRPGVPAMQRQVTDSPDERRSRAERSTRDVPYVRIEAFSLHLHERIYATLLVVALLGIFLPSAATLVWTVDSALARALTIVLGTAALFVIALGLADTIRLLRRFGPDGVRYALHSSQWRRGTPRSNPAIRGSRKFFLELLLPGHREQLRWWGEITGRAIIALVGLIYVILTVTYAIQVRDMALGDQSRFLLLSYRALQLFSGASPLVPLILCGTGFALWSAWHWRLTHHLRTEQTATELAALAHARVKRRRPLADPFSRAAACVENARAALFRIHPTGLGFAITTVLIVLGVLISIQRVGSLEQLAMHGVALAGAYDLLFWIGTFSMLVTGAWAIYRVTATWSALQGALVAVSETPLYNAFGRLPRHVSKLTRLTLFTSNESEAVQHASSERWSELQRHVDELRIEIKRDSQLWTDPKSKRILTRTDRELAVSLHARLAHAGGDAFSSLKPMRRAHLLRKVARALGAVWRRADTSPAPTGTTPLETFELATPLLAVVRTAEEFMAIECVRYVESILHDLRLLASFLLVSLLLSVALLASYPFQPQSIVKLAFVGLLLATVVALFLVMTQMSRDDVLSVITRTEPGKISWDTTLVLNLALFGVIPLLALVSSEFPSVRAFLFSWAEPMVRSLVKV
jgi:hypothetical protein